MNTDGQYKVDGLGIGTYTVVITYKDDSTGKVMIASSRSVNIDDEGQMTISEDLIDPYGTIKDKDTGALINDAVVTLYYANTARNITNGVVPDTIVILPIISGFKPNDNKNPDNDADGEYGFMVYPTTDYYLIAEAGGYQTYNSGTLSVEYTILRHDIAMTKIPSGGGGMPPSGNNGTTTKNKVDLALTLQTSTMKVKSGDNESFTLTYANKSADEAKKVKVEVTVPDKMKFISADNGGVLKGNTITWSFDTLTGGVESKLGFVLKADNQANEFADISSTITSESDVINTEDDTSSLKILLYTYDTESSHGRYIKGYPDGEVKPANIITRAEVAAIFARLLNLKSTVTGAEIFTDVKASFWAAGYIEAVSKAGIFRGYTDGSFKPNQAISRAELATAIARYLGIARDNNLDQYIVLSKFTDTNNTWAAQTIEELFRYNVVKGYSDGTFKPSQDISRAEAITMINRMLYRGPLTNAEPSFKDNSKDKWYFGDIEEATRSHKYTLDIDGEVMILFIEEDLW